MTYWRENLKEFFFDFLECLEISKQKHVKDIIGISEINALIHPQSSDSTSADERTDQVIGDTIRRNQDEHNTLLGTLTDIGVQMGDVSNESIKIKFSLFTEASLEQLKSLVSSGELDRLFTKSYCPQFAHTNLKSLRVEVADHEFERCRKEMTRQHREALKRAKEEAAGKIKVSENLLKRLSLCKYRQQTILGSEDKVEALVDVMLRRPNCEFQELVNALRETDQTEAADYFTGLYFVTFLICCV